MKNKNKNKQTNRTEGLIQVVIHEGSLEHTQSLYSQ